MYMGALFFDILISPFKMLLYKVLIQRMTVST